MISKDTAVRIALAYQEIERGEGLLADVEKAMEARKDNWKEADADLCDVFGRRHRDLQLGIPSGSNGHKLMGVSYELALPVIKAHISKMTAEVETLSVLAKTELENPLRVVEPNPTTETGR